MKKSIILFLLLILSIILIADEYRPYMVVYLHGYNANLFNETNFGTVINYSHIKGKVQNPTTFSPVKTVINEEWGDYYISRNVMKRIEEGKLAHRCLTYNKDILNYWHEKDSLYHQSVYWTKNDVGDFSDVPLFPVREVRTKRVFS
ncbi:MAG: hypothetical protein SVK54_01345 [candidate division WOR-3 bacterium]|nr:hypothetical protein [candidate division WOR-3 bacterium]